MLNPALYQALARAAARGLPDGLSGKNVKVANDNQAYQGTYERSALDDRVRLKTVYGGEHYRVCCFGCGDTRHRLYISHRWNVWDDQTAGYNTHLLHCQNEQCDRNVPGFSRMLADKLTSYMALASRREISVPDVDQVAATADRPIEGPGTCTRVDKLPPNHVCCDFLNARKMDPRLVGPQFGLSFCTHSRSFLARDRLIIPVIMDSKLVAWQARYVGPDGKGDCKNLYRCTGCGRIWRDPTMTPALMSRGCVGCQGEVLPIPKYYTGAGQRKSRVLHNFDGARHYPYVVVVESPLDVIAVGSPDGPCLSGPAVALLGHHPSVDQLRHIGLSWRDGMSIWMLDALAANPTTGEHYSSEWANHINGAHRDGAIAVLLPTAPDGGDLDPGDLPHSDIWARIYGAARGAGKSLLQMR